MKIISIKNRVIGQGMKNAWDECENFTFFFERGGGAKSEEYNFEWLGIGFLDDIEFGACYIHLRVQTEVGLLGMGADSRIVQTSHWALVFLKIEEHFFL